MGTCDTGFGQQGTTDTADPTWPSSKIREVFSGREVDRVCKGSLGRYPDLRIGVPWTLGDLAGFTRGRNESFVGRFDDCLLLAISIVVHAGWRLFFRRESCFRSAPANVSRHESCPIGIPCRVFEGEEGVSGSAAGGQRFLRGTVIVDSQLAGVGKVREDKMDKFMDHV